MTSAVTIPRHGGTGGRTAVAARARQVVKAYGSGETRVVALDHVDVDIARGPVHRDHGPLRLRQVHADALRGRPRHRLRAARSASATPSSTGLKDKQLTQLRRDKIGFIFQAFNLLPTLTALENITLPMDIAGRKPDKEWLDTVDRRPSASPTGSSTGPTQLSGGQQQRVAVARALASRPEIIFGDEPTGNLDSRAGAEVLGFLRNSVRELGQTVVMVTHDPVAAAYADRVVFLADGRIVDEMYRPDRRHGPRPHEGVRRARAVRPDGSCATLRNFSRTGRTGVTVARGPAGVAFVCRHAGLHQHHVRRLRRARPRASPRRRRPSRPPPSRGPRATASGPAPSHAPGARRDGAGRPA